MAGHLLQGSIMFTRHVSLYFFTFQRAKPEESPSTKEHPVLSCSSELLPCVLETIRPSTGGSESTVSDFCCQAKQMWNLILLAKDLPANWAGATWRPIRGSR